MNSKITRSGLRIILLLGAIISLTGRHCVAQGVQEQIPATEYQALVDLYQTTDGPNWIGNEGWLDPRASSWLGLEITGVQTDSEGKVTARGNVTTLVLGAYNLSGSLSNTLGNLSQLRHLHLGLNHLTGNIPSSLGNLLRLQFLNLSFNELTGEIPTELGRLTAATHLDLSFNRLSGAIPDTLGNLANLQQLWLNANQLGGAIPNPLTRLTKLVNLVLFANQLQGDVPYFPGLRSARISLAENCLVVQPGTQSRANINLMITAGNTVLFDPQNSGCGVDLRANSLKWDIQIGGIEFSYAVEGGVLDKPTTAKLFWAKGTNFSDILSPTPILSVNLPAGFRGPATNHAFNTVLQNAPSGATNLLLIVDVENAIPEANESNNLLALQNVQLGVDVSHIQNEAGPIIWPDVKRAGKSFVFVKASEGKNDGENPKGTYQYTTDNINGAIAAGLMVGVYHVARPDLNANAADEAKNFLRRGGNFIGNGFLPPTLDLETNFELPRTMLSQWTRAWLQHVEQETGIKPIIYTTRSVLKDSLEIDLGTEYPLLWIAVSDPAAEIDPAGVPTYHGVSWPEWKFKQYQNESNRGTCAGITGAADLDSFRGDMVSLLALTRHNTPAKFSGVGGSLIQAPKQGQFQFEITAYGRQQITVEKSDSLLTWSEAATLPVSGGKAVFTDPKVGGRASGFYRVKP